MTAVVIDVEQGTREWLEARRQGIGASDIASVLGANPWQSPADVWLSKQPDAEPVSSNAAMEWGKRLEPAVRDAFQDKHPGVFVEPPSPLLQHPDNKIALASLDGVVSARDGSSVLEIKTSRISFDDGLPGYYTAQVQWQMYVTGLVEEPAWVAVLVGGRDYWETRVEYDDEWVRGAVRYASSWWREHVEAGLPPEPDALLQPKLMARLFTPVDGHTAEADPGLVEELLDARELLAEAQARVDRATAQAQTAMWRARADTLTADGTPAVTWKPVKGRRVVDTQRLKDEGLFDMYAKQMPPTRRFTVKGR